jgi:SAM-dependent methyltransferase
LEEKNIRILEGRVPFIQPHPRATEETLIDQYTDLRSIPLPNESIDLIVALNPSNVYPDEDAEEVGNEIYRVLKRGGRVVSTSHTQPIFLSKDLQIFIQFYRS